MHIWADTNNPSIILTFNVLFYKMLKKQRKMIGTIASSVQNPNASEL